MFAAAMAENLGCQSPNIVDRTEDLKTTGQPLADFLLQLEDYTPTVSASNKIVNLILM